MRQGRWIAANALRAMAVAVWAVAAAVGWQAASAAAATAAGQSAPGLVRVKLQHLVLTASGERLAVLEMWNVENQGPRPADLQVTLPEGADDVVMREGSQDLPVDFKPSANGFRLAGWVQPGERVVTFAYTLPGGRDAGFRWARAVPYPVRELVVVVEDGRLEVRSDRLQALGSTELAGRRFKLFGASDLQPGAEVAFDVLPAPASGQGAGGEAGSAGAAGHPDGEHVISTSFHGGNANVRLWQRTTGLSGHGGLLGIFLASALGVAVLCGGVRLAARRRARNGAPRTSAADPARQAALQEERQQLIRQIAELDRRRAAGAIEEAAYVESREQLKRRLVEVMRQLRAV